jgi:hypothetical protein
MSRLSPGFDRPRPKGPRRLGLIAFVVTVAGVLVGSALQFWAGYHLGSIAQFDVVRASIEAQKAIDLSTLPAAGTRIVGEVNTIAIIGSIAYYASAIWGLVQGIVAIVRRRGRAWGVAAIFVVVIGYFVVQLAYKGGLSIGAAPYLN